MIDFTTPYEAVLNCAHQDPVTEILCIRTGALEPIFDSYLRFYDPHIAVRYMDVQAYLESRGIRQQIAVILSLREIAPALWERFYTLDKETREKHTEDVKRLLTHLIQKTESECTRPIFFLLHEESFPQRAGNTYTVQDLTAELNAHILAQIRTTHILSAAAIAEKLPAEAMYDAKMLYRFGCPYSRAGCNALAYYTAQALREVPRKKCIVCDCDEVLWGGILSEDGFDGIVLSGNFSGRAYRDFQRELTRLVSEGILVCLCSKNEESAVREVLCSHPDMILREEHITAMKINHNSKSDNIRALAAELQISAADMVFLDDSDYEIGLIRAELPEVLCVKLDASRPYTHASVLRELPCFFRAYITREDCSRTRQYKETHKRNALLQTASDLSGYHESLQTRLDIHRAAAFDLPRTAQLAQRTNQCNLSDSHLTLPQLNGYAADPAYRILCLYASDIYGDMGQVGAAVLHLGGTEACIEHFWLSCRVFGRGFEEVLLTELKRTADAEGLAHISGIYTATEKNKLFSDFYRKNGIMQR